MRIFAYVEKEVTRPIHPLHYLPEGMNRLNGQLLKKSIYLLLEESGCNHFAIRIGKPYNINTGLKVAYIDAL